MKMNLKKSFTLFALLLFCTMAFSQGKAKFKVVLDAGHGGSDPGTMHNGFVEKEVALNVTLKVGELLEKDPQIEIIYTRKTDIFIGLKERANIANKAHADLFVSIHCNGVDKNKDHAYGTETFVMGLARSAMNLEVAKKENSVITLEADYKTKYNGFDPNSPETTIGLTLMQEQFLGQSVSLASKIQKNFTNDLKRVNRGVKQLPLWVLDATVMPGVLVELGFLSNKNEGSYLNTNSGQNDLAKAIATAITSYKKEYFGNNVSVETTTIPKSEPAKENIAAKETTETTEVSKVSENETGILFKVQIAASSSNLDTKPSNFKGLKNVSKIKNGSLFKYYYGETNSYNESKQLVEQAKAKGYSSAFVVAFKNGKNIKLQEALK